MATISLLNANPSIWKSNFSFPSPSSRLFPNNNLCFIKPTKFSKTLKSNGFTKFSIECFSTKHSKCKDTSSNPFEVYSTSLRSKALKKPAVAAILSRFLLVYGPHLALAASGGRMGGRAFSSRTSSLNYSSSPLSSRISSSSPSNYSSSPSSWSSSSCSSSKHSPTYSSDSSSSSSHDIFVAFFIIVVIVISLMAIVIYHDQYSCSSTRYSYSSTSYSYSSISYLNVQVNVKGSTGSAGELFKKLSIVERRKFDEETLVNVNNKKKKITISEKFDAFNNEYIVVRPTF